MCPPCLLRLALARESEATEPPDPKQYAGEETMRPGTAPDGLPVNPGPFGDFELIEQIGRGAAGLVYKARQVSLDRLIALKILHVTEHMAPEAVRRFRTEAAAAAGLRDACIVTIHEVGVHDGRHDLAMDLVDGPNLARLIAANPLPADRAARLLATVAEAVHHAHEHGIVHRDLKPSNILVDASGLPRVADFGLAKRVHDDTEMTITGQVMGSPNYMSPEQARGEKAGASCDIYALGAVLYQCLTGRPPFLGPTVPETLHHVIHAEPLALRLLVAEVPRDLETIALKCLEKDPAKRYPDARALAEDLHRFLRREPINARPIGRFERLWRWSRRRPAVAGLTGATALLLLAVAVGSSLAAVRIRTERERAEDNLYAADMNLVQQDLAQSSRSQARALLERHRPVPGHTDRRGFEWRYLWERSESDERLVLNALAGERHIVAIANTRFIAAGNHVWDTGPPARTIFTLPEGAVAMASSPDGGVLFAGGNNGLVLWDFPNWKPVTVLANEAVHVVAQSPDGRWMATGREQLRLWARAGDSWRQVAIRPRVFKEWHNSKTLAFSPDSRLLASGTGEAWGDRCTLEFWSVPALDPQPGLPGTPGDIACLAFSPDGRHLLTGCWSGWIRLWDLETRAEIDTTMRHHGFVADLVFSPDDPEVFATTASDRTVRLWNLRTREQLNSLQGPLDRLWAMTYSEDGRTILTLDMHGRIAGWDAAARPEEDAIITQGPRTMPLGFSADGATLATIDETGMLRFWDMRQRRELKSRGATLDLTGVFMRDFEIISPALSPDLARLALGMVDGRVQLRHLPKQESSFWNAHAMRIRNVAFSPDNHLLATVADDGIVKLWRVDSGDLLAEAGVPGPLAGDEYAVPLVWSGDGRTLAVASETEIHLYDGVRLRLLRTLDAEAAIYGVAFAPGDRLLVSAQWDFNLSFWDPRSGMLEARVSTSHPEGAYDLCFPPTAARS